LVVAGHGTAMPAKGLETRNVKKERSEPINEVGRVKECYPSVIVERYCGNGAVHGVLLHSMARNNIHDILIYIVVKITRLITPE